MKTRTLEFTSKLSSHDTGGGSNHHTQLPSCLQAENLKGFNLQVGGFLPWLSVSKSVHLSFFRFLICYQNSYLGNSKRFQKQ